MNLIIKSSIILAVMIGISIVAGAIAICLTGGKGPFARSVKPPDRGPRKWWRSFVLYQVYVRSFKDGDGDGVGDLKGITTKLDHFVDAGVNAISLSTIFEMDDAHFEDDVIDFYTIQKEYGTMEDFQELVEKAHRLGLKILLEFIPNHVSIKSDYFKKSEARVPGFEDFFVWADPRLDSDNATNRIPPSNWVNQIGGSSWEWSETRNQYYLHQFLVQQADFNFRNQAVMKEMKNVMTFWMNKGVDGFKISFLPHLVEADRNDGSKYPYDLASDNKRHNPDDPGHLVPLYTKDLMDSYEVLYKWREFLVNYNYNNGGDERVILADVPNENITKTMRYYGSDDDLLGATFVFNHLFISDLSITSTARDFVYVVFKWSTYMPNDGVANWMLGSLNTNRVTTRFLPDMIDGMNALIMMLPGVAVSYQGEEIGMRDGDHTKTEARNIKSEENYGKYCHNFSRTPFYWDNSTNAGFSTAKQVWLAVAKDYEEINLKKQKTDERSHFKIYKALTSIRNQPTLYEGDYDIKPLTDRSFYLLRYLSGHETLVLIFNVSGRLDKVFLDRVKRLKLPATVFLVSLHSNKKTGGKIIYPELLLDPGEALVLRAAPINIT